MPVAMVRELPLDFVLDDSADMTPNRASRRWTV